MAFPTDRAMHNSIGVILDTAFESVADELSRVCLIRKSSKLSRLLLVFLQERGWETLQ